MECDKDRLYHPPEKLAFWPEKLAFQPERLTFSRKGTYLSSAHTSIKIRSLASGQIFKDDVNCFSSTSDICFRAVYCNG